MGKFIMQTETLRDNLDWGSLAWLSNPPATGARNLTVIDVLLKPGEGHNFHRHDGQEEVLVVVSGTVEQWVMQEKRILRAGDAAFIDSNEVHASFNVGDDDVKIVAILGPCLGDVGYIVEDVAQQEPWCSIR